MDDGSIRNVGVIFNATSMDGGSAEFCRERIRATAMDGGSIRNAGVILMRPPWMEEVLNFVGNEISAPLPHSLY